MASAVTTEKDLENGTSTAPTLAPSINESKAPDALDAEHGGDLEKKPTELPADQYPHGMKLVLLSSAALVAVFLIALDQVSPCP